MQAALGMGNMITVCIGPGLVSIICVWHSCLRGRVFIAAWLQQLAAWASEEFPLSYRHTP